MEVYMLLIDFFTVAKIFNVALSQVTTRGHNETPYSLRRACKSFIMMSEVKAHSPHGDDLSCLSLSHRGCV